MKLIIKGELNILTESGIQINSRLIELLKLVRKTGSLNTATKIIGISYSNAWNTLYKLNCHLNNPVISTCRGGVGGGLTNLTETGQLLLKEYENLEREFDEFLNEHTIHIPFN